MNDYNSRYLQVPCKKISKGVVMFLTMNKRFDMEAYNSDGEILTVYRFSEGGKTLMPNKKICLKVDAELNKLGVKTRTGYGESGWWSIYVISVPDDFYSSIQIYNCTYIYMY